MLDAQGCDEESDVCNAAYSVLIYARLSAHRMGEIVMPGRKLVDKHTAV